MIHLKDHLIYVGSFIIDDRFIYKITKIDITETIDTINYKNIIDQIDKMKTYNRYIDNFKTDYNIGDPYSKRYYAVKRYKINNNSLTRVNGRVPHQFACASYFSILDDDYLNTLIKNITIKLGIYADLLASAKIHAPKNP